MDGITLLVLAAITVVVLFFLYRANEIFCVSVRDGRVLVVRGAVPPPLLNGMADIVRRDRVVRGTIRAVKSEGHARLVTRGLGEGTTQRLRNAFGTHPIHKLRAASAPKVKNLGQMLGIAWLAWALLGSGRSDG
ncbi:MAG: DUF3634 family protein [Sandaracinaceae bacterium]